MPEVEIGREAARPIVVRVIPVFRIRGELSLQKK